MAGLSQGQRAMTMFTVLGAGGFIGAHLAARLRADGQAVQLAGRADDIPQKLGHAIYCIGVTGDYRSRPFDTVAAHVEALRAILESCQFESFTYLSSTRVYRRLPAETQAREDAIIPVSPNDPGDLYALSKLMGESLCLSQGNPAVRVARVSHVYGANIIGNDLLSSLLRDALKHGHARLQSGANAAKDYIDIDDVTAALAVLPHRAKSRLINLAAGINVSNAEIAGLFDTHLGCKVLVERDAEEFVYPRIAIEKLISELGIVPRSLPEQFSSLVARFRQALDNVHSP